MSTVLIVDDDLGVAELLHHILADAGYATVAVTRSLRMLDAVREHQPDVILLDYMMPYLDGRDELALLRLVEGARTPPVILVTAHMDAIKNVAELRRAGVVDVIRKPFDIMQVLHSVEQALVVAQASFARFRSTAKHS